MKAELDATGCLVIKAESQVESFALGHWFDLWLRKEATLRVETPKEVPFVLPSETNGPSS